MTISTKHNYNYNYNYNCRNRRSRCVCKPTRRAQEWKTLIVQTRSSVKGQGLTCADQLLFRPIGIGCISTVYAVVQQRQRLQRAVKVVPKNGLHAKLVATEVECLQTVQHPNIVKMVSFHETARFYFVTTELAAGGTLLDRLNACPTQFDESDTRVVVAQLLLALRHLNENGYVHRDVKPENVLLRNGAGGSLEVVLTGMKLVQRRDLDGGELVTGVVGSFGYMAPELLEHGGVGELWGVAHRGYTASCDIWAVGVIVYQMLSGHGTGVFPAGNGTSGTTREDAQAFLSAVKSNRFLHWPLPGTAAQCSHGGPHGVSSAGRDFLLRCLDVDHRRRPIAAKLVAHPWLTV